MRFAGKRMNRGVADAQSLCAERRSVRQREQILQQDLVVKRILLPGTGVAGKETVDRRDIRRLYLLGQLWGDIRRWRCFRRLVTATGTYSIADRRGEQIRCG